MKLTTNLEDIHRTVAICVKESMCTYGDRPDHAEVCPIYVEGRSYTSSPGGLVYLVRAILEGKVEYSGSMAELAFACAGCGACEKFCELLHFPVPHVGPWEIIRLLRYQLVKRGFLPEGKLKSLSKKVEKNGDYLDNQGGVNLKIPAGIKDDKSDRVLYAECFHTESQKGIYEAAVRLLEKVGQPISVFSDGGCCGSTLYDEGLWDPLGKLVEGKWEKMRDGGSREYLFINPHCQEFVVKRYPEILPGYQKIKSRHFSEFLAESFRAGKLRSKKGRAIKVSYHDPCYLGRGLGIYDAPREVLRSMDGVELIEMKGNRVDSFCCGARSTGNYFSNFSKRNAKKRLQTFSATGAEMLITSCPYCKEIFQKALPEKERKRVKDLAEFAEERTE